MTTTYKSLNFLEKTKYMMGNHETKLDYFLDLATQGDVIHITGAMEHFFVNDPQVVHHILVTNEKNYTKAGTTIMRTRDILGVGQLTNYGEEWAMGRQKLQANFYHKNLPQVFDILNLKIDRLLDGWEEHIKTRHVVNLMEEMCALSLEVSTALLFGSDADIDYRKTVRAFRFANGYVTKANYLWPWKPTVGNLRFQMARHLARKLSTQVSYGPHDDFPGLSPLLEPTFLNGDESEQEREWAVGQASNFFLASHDTTASVIAWLYFVSDTVYGLQDSLQAEAQSVLGQQAPSFENYSELTYTRQVLQETMRLYPPVWVIERRAIEPDVIGPYQVPADSRVVICPFVLHRHPEYWNNPEYFSPKRFRKDQAKDRPKSTYIPFGIGPRVCTGQHLAMMIAMCIVSKISQRFHLCLANKTPVTYDPLLTLKSTPDIQVRIQSI